MVDKERRRRWYKRNREEFKKAHNAPAGCDWPIHDGEDTPQWLQRRISDVWAAEKHLTIADLCERFGLSEERVRLSLKRCGLYSEYRRLFPVNTHDDPHWPAEFIRQCERFALKRRGGVPPISKVYFADDDQ